MKSRWLIGLLLVALAVGAYLGTNAFLNSPTYALYQIGRAIHNRDPGLFITYVDIDRIYHGQRDNLVDLVVTGKEREDTRRVVKGFLTALAPQITTEVRRKVILWVADPKRDNIPSSWTLVAAANITRRPGYALVVLSDPEKKQRLRLGMQRKEGKPWRVVEVDPRDLKRILSTYWEAAR